MKTIKLGTKNSTLVDDEAATLHYGVFAKLNFKKVS